MVACKSDSEESKTVADESLEVFNPIAVDTVTKKEVVISKEERMKQATSLWSMLVKDPENMTFVRNIVTSGVADVLHSQSGPFTVIAPSNSAFSKLTKDQQDYLSNPKNLGELVALIKRHILVGAFDSEKLFENVNTGNGSFMVTTISGEKLTISKKGKSLVVKSAEGVKGTIVKSDIEGSNGVLHVLDVLLMD